MAGIWCEPDEKGVLRQGLGERARCGRVPAIRKELGEGGRPNTAHGSVFSSCRLQVVNSVTDGVSLYHVCVLFFFPWVGATADADWLHLRLAPFAGVQIF